MRVGQNKDKSNRNLARAAGRVIGKKSMGNRYVRGGISAADSTLRATARAGKILWLEVIGLLCGIFAFSLGGQLWHEYQNRRITDNSGVRIGACALALLLFAWFAASSFWRARRLKRA
ncbi:MAG: hypothetical protein ABI383_08825 [Acidobacteriaceae bacterium]